MEENFPDLKKEEPIKVQEPYCLSYVTIAVIKYHDQSILVKKGFIGLCVHITACHQRKSGQELKQGRNLGAGAYV